MEDTKRKNKCKRTEEHFPFYSNFLEQSSHIPAIYLFLTFHPVSTLRSVSLETKDSPKPWRQVGSKSAAQTWTCSPHSGQASTRKDSRASQAIKHKKQPQPFIIIKSDPTSKNLNVNTFYYMVIYLFSCICCTWWLLLRYRWILAPTVTQVGLHHLRVKKQLIIYPICDDRRPGYYIISVPYPGFNHSNENYRDYLFLAKVYDLGLLIHFPWRQERVTPILNNNLSQPRIIGQSH